MFQCLPQAASRLPEFGIHVEDKLVKPYTVPTRPPPESDVQRELLNKTGDRLVSHVLQGEKKRRGNSKSCLVVQIIRQGLSRELATRRPGETNAGITPPFSVGVEPGAKGCALGLLLANDLSILVLGDTILYHNSGVPGAHRRDNFLLIATYKQVPVL